MFDISEQRQQLIWNDRSIYLTLRKTSFMRKGKKEILYRAAFKLFISRQFEGVSLSDIENESGLTKGAIYYYASSKKELFRNVIEYYIIEKQDLTNKVSLKGATGLKDFIDSYIEGIVRTMESLSFVTDELSHTNPTKAYISLILQIAQYFPDLNNKFSVSRNNEIGIWCAMLQKAIENDEIRNDIDLLSTAKQFMTIFYGQVFLDALLTGLNICTLSEQLYNLYKLLKK